MAHTHKYARSNFNFCRHPGEFKVDNNFYKVELSVKIELKFSLMHQIAKMTTHSDYGAVCHNLVSFLCCL